MFNISINFKENLICTVIMLCKSIIYYFFETKFHNH